MFCCSKPSRRNIPEKTSVEVELKINMHCENCAKDVKRVTSKFEGVEACITDMDKQKVMVSGKFNLEMLLKTLKKKTGKKAEILMKNEKVDDVAQKEDDEHEKVDDVAQKEDEIIPENNEEGNTVPKMDHKSPQVEETSDKPKTSITEVEIHVAFLCKKYEKTIGKVISEFEGVNTCVVDIENQKVVITGDFDEGELLRKLKKRLRKEVEKKGKKKEEKPFIDENEKAKTGTDKDEESGHIYYVQPNSDDEEEMALYMKFSDDNPNACCIS